MENIVTYGAPGVEISQEPSSKLSKCQMLFIVALPLVFLFGVLLRNIITRSLDPVVSSNPLLSSLIGFALDILVFVIFIPKVLRMPKGRTTLRNYLHTIGVDRIRPVTRTLLIFVPCLISIAVAQIVGSLVYNHFILGSDPSHFTKQIFNSFRITNVIGSSPITAVGSIFEEIILRGVVLTMLLQAYSKRKAIAISAVTFGYIHILNLLNGPLTYELVTFVVGQIIWASIIGILYGYMFLIAGNLYANMFLHCFANGMSNCFMYLPYVTPEVHALLNIIFNIGLMSTVISLCWIFLVDKYWPLKKIEETESICDNSDTCLLERFSF